MVIDQDILNLTMMQRLTLKDFGSPLVNILERWLLILGNICSFQDVWGYIADRQDATCWKHFCMIVALFSLTSSAAEHRSCSPGWQRPLHHGEIKNVLVNDHKLLMGNCAKTFFLHSVGRKNTKISKTSSGEYSWNAKGIFSNIEKNVDSAYEYRVTTWDGWRAAFRRGQRSFCGSHPYPRHITCPHPGIALGSEWLFHTSFDSWI